MQRRLYLAGALCSLLAVASATYAAGSAKPAPNCSPARSNVLVSNDDAQVFQQGETAERGAIRGRQMIFGCIRGRRGAYPLGTALGTAPFGSRTVPVRVSQVTLAGPIVAYERHSAPSVGPESSFILVRDLRTGRLLHSAPAETLDTPPPDLRPDLSPMRIAAIVLKGDGAVAWIVETGNGNSPYYQLHAIDQSGSRVLATVNAITPHSLSLDENLLTWAQPGGLRAAELN